MSRTIHKTDNVILEGFQAILAPSKFGYSLAAVVDQGIIDPRDTRKVLSFSLKTFSEAKDRILKPNSFGIARM